MKIIIDIPEELYEAYKGRPPMLGDAGMDMIAQSIANGTPLPKGHGRLGDLDNIWSELKELEEHYQAEFLKKSNAIHESAMCGRYFGFTASKFIVQDAPTIIGGSEE